LDEEMSEFDGSQLLTTWWQSQKSVIFPCHEKRNSNFSLPPHGRGKALEDTSSDYALIDDV
jgi:hypothetical protein